ncbi:hypothetical protein VKT23_013078 [Stygiomarasmius scandens]|uniref:Uncharacterized protein n=1 Tax=Marasmiellus scandens TaxID=2682957 RepID=A0ABR1J7S9_9AGAR
MLSKDDADEGCNRDSEVPKTTPKTEMLEPCCRRPRTRRSATEAKGPFLPCLLFPYPKLVKILCPPRLSSFLPLPSFLGNHRIWCYAVRPFLTFQISLSLSDGLVIFPSSIDFYSLATTIYLSYSWRECQVGSLRLGGPIYHWRFPSSLAGGAEPEKRKQVREEEHGIEVSVRDGAIGFAAALKTKCNRNYPGFVEQTLG